MNIKVFYVSKVSKVDFNTLGAKFPSRWHYHYWWASFSILKVVFKATSLQYLYNIWKKKLGIEFIFCMQIIIKVCTSWHYLFFMEVARHVQSTRKCCYCFCILLWCKTFIYFMGSGHVYCYLLPVNFLYL